MQSPMLKPLLRRSGVMAWLESLGIRPWDIRTMLEDGTIKPVKIRSKGWAYYSRDQIADQVLGGLSLK